jgi:hypothetical protein
MRLIPIILAVVMLVADDSGAQPATTPTTAPAEIFLDGGKLVFTPPGELTFLGKRDDDRSVGFSLGDNHALLTILVTPQKEHFPRSAAPGLAKLLGDTIRTEAKRGEIDIVMHPKVEPDDRFLVVVHDRFNTDERFGDRRQMYRSIGFHLCCVVATAFTEDQAEAKRVHELGAQMLLSVRPNKPGARKPVATPRTPATRPITFDAAHVRVTPPTGWSSEPNPDASGGVVVTFREEQDPTNLIAVSVRQLPAAAARDPKLRDILIDEVVQAEKQSFKIGGAEVIGQAQEVTDRRFLRKTRTDYAHEGKRFRVVSRQVRAGAAVVSVTIVAGEENADRVDAVADRVALDVRPMAAR